MFKNAFVCNIIILQKLHDIDETIYCQSEYKIYISMKKLHVSKVDRQLKIHVPYGQARVSGTTNC